MRIYRLLWWILAAPLISVGVVGAIATSSVLTVVIVFAIMAFSLGALSSNLQSLDRDGEARGSMSMSTVIRHGCVAGVAVVAFFGLAAVAGIAVLLAVLIVGASPVVAGARAPSDPARYLLAPPTTGPSDAALTDGESE